MIGTKEQMDCAGIYKISIGSNFYFGSAVVLKHRKWSHITDLRRRKHSNRRMQNAFNKYGEFAFEVVEIVDYDGDGFKSALLSREQHYIDNHFSNERCMNLSPTAGNCLGIKHTEEARKNMSRAHIGLALGMFHPHYGKPKSDETRRKLSDALKGVPYSEERKKAHKKTMNKKSFRDAISKAQTGRIHTPEHIEARIKHQRGAGNCNARSVWVEHPLFGRIEGGTISFVANLIAAKRIDLIRWLNGSRNWPGQGPKIKGRHTIINGIKGGYLT